MVVVLGNHSPLGCLRDISMKPVNHIQLSIIMDNLVMRHKSAKIGNENLKYLYV